MTFGKSKTRRLTPLQVLNDRRQSVVLAGLAAGAVTAAIFRRRKSGGGVEFGEPMVVAEPPEPVAGSMAVGSAPRPPLDSQPASKAAADVAGSSAGAPSTSKVEPATGELSAEEASILAVLAQSGRADDDRTAIAVATSLERETPDVAAVLRKLGAEGVVSGELYTASGEKIWAVTERGVRRLGAQH